MKEINEELLKLLNGCEVLSLKYATCVSIKGDEVISDGKVIDTLDTDKKVSKIWKEYMKQEGL